MKKLKVVIIQEYNTPYRNDLFNKLHEFDDIDLHLFYTGSLPPSRQWKEKLISNFHEHHIKTNSINTGYETNENKINYFHLLKIYFNVKPDVIVTQIGLLSVLLYLMGIFRKQRFVYWNEATIITDSGRKINWKYRLFKGKFRAFLSVGKLSTEYLKYAGYKVNSKNTFVMPNSVGNNYNISSDELSYKLNNTFPLRIIFVGSLIKRKGFDLLLEAISDLNSLGLSQKIHFDIIGSGTIEKKSFSNVTYHGFLDMNQSLLLYKKSHAIILPSLWDCNPLVVIEALKCGNIPLLSDGVGCYPELIRDNGFVFKRNSSEEIMSALCKVLNLGAGDLESMITRSLELVKDITHDNCAVVFRNAILFESNGE